MKSKIPMMAVVLSFILGTFTTVAIADHHKGHVLSRQTVVEAQEELKDKDYYQAHVDGLMGPKTRAALRAYQRDKGLTPDGRLTRETAEHLGIAKSRADGDDATVDDHFEEAAAAIGEHYEEAGKAIGHGSKELGQEVSEGEVVEGGKEFGKGVGEFGKEVGKGTGKAAKKVGEGVVDVFDGDDDEEDEKKDSNRN